MEKLLNIDIRDKINSSIPIHSTQYAYQQGKSTELALHKLVSRIKKTFEAKEFSLAAFLDIEGAFDNTGYDAIVRAFIYVLGPFEDTVRTIMESALSTVKNWCNNVGLNVDSAKTTLAPITRKKS